MCRVPTTLPAIDHILLLLGELRVLELLLLLLREQLPELVELRHRQRVLLGVEVLLDVHDGVLSVGHYGPFRLCACTSYQTSVVAS